MNFIKENIKSKKNRKKGFTLIELMISSSLIGIVICSQIIVLCKYMRIHKQEINKSRESFYVNEAFMIIEHQISIAKYIKVENDVIILKSYDRARYDYIRKDKDPDIIISYDSMYSSNTNNILKNIKDFKVKQDDQLLYITIETKKGNIYRRCLGSERVQKKDTS